MASTHHLPALMSRQSANHTGEDPKDYCTLGTCPIDLSIYQYRPSIAANTIFLVIFALVLFVQVFQGIKWRSWGYMISMVLGCICEVVGYGGRIMLWQNPFNFTGFIIQIVCLTIGPAFYSAAIYLTLHKIVIYLGVTYSRFRPSLFYWIFIPCDIVSLALQAAGGAISSSANTEADSNTGEAVAIAGLVFQVVTLSVFTLLAADYFYAWFRGTRRSGTSVHTPVSFQVFVWSLSAAMILILIRCVYRIDELSQGYDGPLISNEGLFIALEGAMVAAAAIILCIGHPGIGFRSTANVEGNMSKSGFRSPMSSDVETGNAALEK